jgi:hypothetical protein
VNHDRLVRFAAVLVGAGSLAYIVTLVVLGLVFGSSGQAK